MNTFQENLQKAVYEITKVSEIIIASDKTSQLDIDILLERLRKAYDVAISFETEKEEIPFQAPIIIDKEEKEPEHKEVPEILIEEEDLEEDIELFEQRSASKQIVIEPEILFDTQTQEEEEVKEDIVKEVKIVETPSVLKYLNEQMPKNNEVGQMFEKKEIEHIPNNPIVQEHQEKEIEIETPHIETPSEEKSQQEKLVIEKPIITSNKNTTIIGERYTQNKSVFDNISNSINKGDVASRFKSNNFDLRTAIGVNEKFMFINDLFSGNLRQYTEFIQKLNDAESLEVANQILNTTKEEKRWIANSLPYTTLHEIMIKKFHY